jgi:hypothetical protein
MDFRFRKEQHAASAAARNSSPLGLVQKSAFGTPNNEFLSGSFKQPTLPDDKMIVLMQFWKVISYCKTRYEHPAG